MSTKDYNANSNSDRSKYPMRNSTIMKIPFLGKRQQIATINLLLGFFYATFGSIISFQAGRLGIQIEKLRLMFITLWMGFVLAISFMEGWLKFQAPFLPRHLALDVGRHIFAALNAVEMGLCFCQWLLLIIYKDLKPIELFCIMSLSIMLMVQVLIITPSLIDRGKFVVMTEVSKDRKGLTPQQRVILEDLEIEFGGRKELTSKISHFAYLVLELLKVCSGFVFIYHLLGV